MRRSPTSARWSSICCLSPMETAALRPFSFCAIPRPVTRANVKALRRICGMVIKLETDAREALREADAARRNAGG